VVKAGKIKVFRRRVHTFSTSTTLKISDAKAIKEQIDHVIDALPSYHVSYPVRQGGVTVFTTIIGVDNKYLKIRNLNILEGRSYTDTEEKTGEKVIVLGYKIAQDFFGNKNPVGKTLLIFRAPCKVVGVLEEKGADISGDDQDILIYTPLKTAMRRLANVDYINTIYVQVDDDSSIPYVKRKIRELLRKRHNLKPGDKDDFTVLSPDDYLRMEREALRIFSILGGVSAAISFLIGGLGILSIMILIVNERIEEIGIRRAVGAKRYDILTQFLLESGFIAFAGGLLGAVLGAILSIGIFAVFKLPPTLSSSWIMYSFGLSVATGLLSGIYPAFKAASIKPIEALRRG